MLGGVFKVLSDFLAVTLGADDNQGASIKKRWIRTNFDADGYFLLQLVGKFRNRFGFDEHIKDMYLTADDASSLTIQGTLFCISIGMPLFGSHPCYPIICA